MLNLTTEKALDLTSPNDDNPQILTEQKEELMIFRQARDWLHYDKLIVQIVMQMNPPPVSPLQHLGEWSGEDRGSYVKPKTWCLKLGHPPIQGDLKVGTRIQTDWDLEKGILEVLREHHIPVLMDPKTKITISIFNLVSMTVVEARDWSPASTLLTNSIPRKPYSGILNLLKGSFPQHLVHFSLKCLSLDKPRDVGRKRYEFHVTGGWRIGTQFQEQRTSTTQGSTLNVLRHHLHADKMEVRNLQNLFHFFLLLGV